MRHGKALYQKLDWLTVLIDHYMDLLQAEGDQIEDLIKSVYKSRTNYLLFFNRLNSVEKKFNSALKPHFPAKPNPAIAHFIEDATVEPGPVRIHP